MKKYLDNHSISDVISPRLSHRVDSVADEVMRIAGPSSGFALGFSNVNPVNVAKVASGTLATSAAIEFITDRHGRDYDNQLYFDTVVEKIKTLEIQQQLIENRVNIIESGNSNTDHTIENNKPLVDQKLHKNDDPIIYHRWSDEHNKYIVDHYNDGDSSCEKPLNSIDGSDHDGWCYIF